MRFKASLQTAPLADVLAARPPELHVGCAPALSDTRGEEPKTEKPDYRPDGQPSLSVGHV